MHYSYDYSKSEEWIITVNYNHIYSIPEDEWTEAQFNFSISETVQQYNMTVNLHILH